MIFVEVTLQSHNNVVILYWVSNLSKFFRNNAIFEEMSDLRPIVTLRLAQP
jgi:hypothetical protein